MTSLSNNAYCIYIYHTIMFSIFVYIYITYIQTFVKTEILLLYTTTSVLWLYIHWLSHFSRTNFYVAEVNTNRPEIFLFLFQTRFVHENLSAVAQISDQKLCRSVTILCNRRRFCAIFIWRTRVLPIATQKYRVSILSCSFIRIRPYDSVCEFVNLQLYFSLGKYIK